MAGVSARVEVRLSQRRKSGFDLIHALHRRVRVADAVEDVDGDVERGQHFAVGRERLMTGEPGAGEAHGVVFRQPRIVAARDGGKQRLVARGEHRREVRRCEGAVAVHVHVFKGGAAQRREDAVGVGTELGLRHAAVAVRVKVLAVKDHARTAGLLPRQRFHHRAVHIAAQHQFVHFDVAPRRHLRGDHRALAPAQQRQRAVCQALVLAQGAHHGLRVADAVFRHVGLVGSLVNVRVEGRFAARRAAARTPAEKGRSTGGEALGKEVEVVVGGGFVQLAGVVIGVRPGAVDEHHQPPDLPRRKVELAGERAAVFGGHLPEFRRLHLSLPLRRAQKQRQRKKRQPKPFHVPFLPRSIWKARFP